MSLNIPVISAGLRGDGWFYGRVVESQILAFLSKITLTEEVKNVRLDNQSGTDIYRSGHNHKQTFVLE